MRRAIVYLGLLAALASGCATPSPPPAPPVAAAPAPPAPAPPLPELPASPIEQRPDTVTPRPLFTFSVRDASIRDVLLALSKRTEVNIVFGPDVEGQVTVDLKRVTLEEALDALLTPIGLTWRREGNFLRVSKPGLETRIFTVNYIATVRSGGSTTAAAAGGTAGAALAVTGAVTGVTGAVTTGGAATAGTTSSVSSTDSVDFWDELERTLTGLLSSEGKIVLSKTSGLVAVTDFPANLRRVAQYLEAVQGSAQRQVMIETQIIEVELNKEFSAGIDWSLIPRQLRFDPLGNIKGGLTGGALAAQTLAAGAATLQIGIATRLAGQGLDALLRALSTQGKVTVLSRPKISTLNNQKAVIKVATDDVFFTVIRTREAATGIVTENVIPQTVTEGIVLDVTPQIGEDDAVIMSIRPSITERVGQATSPQGGTVPIVAVRASDTVVRVRDGQTVIIGGLMQNRVATNTSGVPGLQSVPILGYLFKSQGEEVRKTELVILLTPTVLIGRRHSELTPQELELLRQVGRARPVP